MQIKKLFSLFVVAVVISGCTSLGFNREACSLAQDSYPGILHYIPGLLFLGDCSLVHKWRVETGRLLLQEKHYLLDDVIGKGGGGTLRYFAKIFRCEAGSEKVLAEKLLQHKDEIFFLNETNTSLDSKDRIGMLKIYELLRTDQDLKKVCHYYD